MIISVSIPFRRIPLSIMSLHTSAIEQSLFLIKREEDRHVLAYHCDITRAKICPRKYLENSLPGILERRTMRVGCTLIANGVNGVVPGTQLLLYDSCLNKKLTSMR